MGGKVARAGGMEALGSAGAGEGLAPTLPGGLVVRIRRSHRRGPGSIPGQGSLSSSSPEACHLPPAGVLAGDPPTLRKALV